MTQLLACLLTLLFSLSGPAMERNAGFWQPSLAARGLTTPSKYFGNQTAQEVSEAMTKKFGPPKSVREGAETFYNPKTQRSFNVHTDPAHGPPHVDVRRRGGYPEQKYPLAEGQP